jgi:hypothetical protein
MIELGKKYVTRDGRPVRILCTDAGEPCTVVGLAWMNGVDMMFRWPPDGRHEHSHRLDLAEVPTAEDVVHAALAAPRPSGISVAAFICAKLRIEGFLKDES